MIIKVKFKLANNEALATYISKSTYNYIYNRWKEGQDIELGNRRSILNSEIKEIEVVKDEKWYTVYASRTDRPELCYHLLAPSKDFALDIVSKDPRIKEWELTNVWVEDEETR